MLVQYLGDRDELALEVVDEGLVYYIVKIPHPTVKYPFAYVLMPVMKNEYSPVQSETKKQIL